MPIYENQRYLFDGKIRTHEELETPEGQNLLKIAHADKLRPLCQCRPHEELPMYVAYTNGVYILKRMPETGKEHDLHCSSFEDPDATRGIDALYQSGAITEDPESGTLHFRLAFRLNAREKSGPRIQGEEQSRVTTRRPQKVTLPTFLERAWDSQHFNHWSPSRTGKRAWSLVRHYLLKELGICFCDAGSLKDYSYLPPDTDDTKYPIPHDQIVRERIQCFASTRGKSAEPSQYRIFIGELENIADNFGDGILRIRFFEDSIHLSAQVYKSFRKNFDPLLQIREIEDHYIVICTMGLSASGAYVIDEISVMATDKNWLPFYNKEEKQLLAQLDKMKRLFIRPLRTQRSEEQPVAAAKLIDTGEPQPLYILYQLQKSRKV